MTNKYKGALKDIETTLEKSYKRSRRGPFSKED
jgi:hypothetical protein